MSNLIHNLRMLRRERNISAIQLTNELNLNGSRITDIENSNNRNVRVTLEEITEIANYFGIDVDTLMNKRAYIVFK